MTIDPSVIGELTIGILVAVAAALVALIRVSSRLSVVNKEVEIAKKETEKVRQASLQQDIEHKGELQAARLANEKSALDYQAGLQKLGMEYTQKIQVANQKLQEDIHALTLEVAELRGQVNNQTKVQKALEDRLQTISEQKIAAYQKLTDVESERDAAALADRESRSALVKANEINQTYKSTIDEQKTTILTLQHDLMDAKARVTKLETEVDQLQKSQDARHQRLNDVTAENLQYTVQLTQMRAALKIILTAIPLSNMPPDVIKNLHAGGIPDLAALITPERITDVASGSFVASG